MQGENIVMSSLKFQTPTKKKEKKDTPTWRLFEEFRMMQDQSNEIIHCAVNSNKILETAHDDITFIFN